MGDHLMSEEMPEKDYTVSITALMPGAAKETTYKIPVKARSNAQALVQGEEEWRRATEPRDVRVKLAEAKQ